MEFNRLMNRWCVVVLLSTISIVGFADYAGADSLLVSGFNKSILQYDATTGAFTGTFVAPGSGGLEYPYDIVFAPNGNLLVTDDHVVGGLAVTSSILEYNPTNGAPVGMFVSPASGGLIAATSMVYGPNGNLFVDDFTAHNVKEYNGSTGAFIGVFASTNLNAPQGIAFGPDGNLYVADETNVVEFNGTTGAFIKTLPNPGSDPTGLTFGPNGNLFVASCNEVLEYNGTNGAVIGAFVPPGSGGLACTTSTGYDDLQFEPDGELLVSNAVGNDILAFNSTTGAFIGDLVTPGSGGLSTPIDFLVVSSTPSTVPEPNSLVLFCVGTLLVVFAGLRRRKGLA